MDEKQVTELQEKISKLEKDNGDLKTKNGDLTVQLAEATKDDTPISPKKFNALKAENTQLLKENDELKTGQQKATAAVKLAEMLKESKLPEPAQKKLTERFKDAISDEDFQEAITEERAYLKSVGGKTEVRNLGEGHNRTSDNVDHKLNLIEGFKNMGMTEEQAKIAAAGRR